MATTSRGAVVREAVAIFLLLASQLPFVLDHGYNIWRMKPYAQFVPLLVIIIGWLLYCRWPESDRVRAPSWFALSLLVIAFLMMAAAVALFSSWLAAIATVLTVGSLLCYFDGRGRWRRWLPVWVLLWLAITPPTQMDRWITARLQTVATRMSGLVLDAVNLPHAMEGNVVVLPEGRLMVEEACSGFNSQFTLLAATAVLVVLFRRPLIWSVLMLTSSVIWAALTNLGRVVTIVIAQSEFGVDLSSGWMHDALGYVALLAAVLMILSTDMLCAFLLGPINVPPEDPEDVEDWKNTIRADSTLLARVWDWFVDARRGLRYAQAQLDQPTGEGTDAVGPRWHARASHILLTIGFIALGCMQLAILRSPAWRPPEGLAGFSIFDRSILPVSVDGWTQADFDKLEREPDSDLGWYSQYWVYESDSCSCVLSADYPFMGWHELTNCYSRTGWDIVRRSLISPNSAPDGGNRVVEVQLAKPTGEHALLLFSLLHEDGSEVEPPAPFAVAVARRLASNPLWSNSPLVRTATVQVQAFAETNAEISDEDREEVRHLFVQARARLRASMTSARETQ